MDPAKLPCIRSGSGSIFTPDPAGSGSCPIPNYIITVFTNINSEMSELRIRVY